MASRTSLDKKIISILKYDTSRPYFGKLKFSELYRAQGTMRRDEYYNANGSRDARILVGKIDGDIICNALWRLMEYNPGRFTTNPFLYDGKNNIFKFVKNRIVLPTDATTADIIIRIRQYLYDYLIANSAKNGQWQDAITTMDGGYVYTVLNDGRTGPMYKKLCLLREAVKLITAQNCADFDSKRGPYRAQIIQAVQQRHPEIFKAATDTKAPVANIATEPTSHHEINIDIDAEEDKIYEKMEHIQITLNNRGNISNDLYEQAQSEMAALMNELREIRNRHTL